MHPSHAACNRTRFRHDLVYLQKIRLFANAPSDNNHLNNNNNNNNNNNSAHTPARRSSFHRWVRSALWAQRYMVCWMMSPMVMMETTWN
jgi:hypothetical protein